MTAMTAQLCQDRQDDVARSIRSPYGGILFAWIR
jgi:hypothetical protein